MLLHSSGGVYADARADLRGTACVDGGCRLSLSITFGSRRERGAEFLERVLNITETMMLADAYSGLAFLATRPEKYIRDGSC